MVLQQARQTDFETAGKTATNTQGGEAGIKFCKSTPSPFGYTANGGKVVIWHKMEKWITLYHPSVITPGWRHEQAMLYTATHLLLGQRQARFMVLLFS